MLGTVLNFPAVTIPSAGLLFLQAGMIHRERLSRSTVGPCRTVNSVPPSTYPCTV